MKQIIIIVILILISGAFIINKNVAKEESKDTVQQNIKEREAYSDVSTISSSKTIDLSGQNLSKTPDYIFNQTNTEELDLSNNSIDGALQSQIQNLQNLKILNLSNNVFTGVPAEVGQLKNLEILDLSNNRLTGLPYEIGNIKNLKILNLSGNQYSEQDLNIIKKNLPSTVNIITN